MDALRLSIEETRGLKGRMFGADIVILLAVTVLLLILSLLGLLPIVGWIFRLLFVLMVFVCAALLPLVINLLSAAFYTEAHRIPELNLSLSISVRIAESSSARTSSTADTAVLN
jgi:hypothetical protein